MTEVLKKESSTGKNYDALFDGARSLASGLGSVHFIYHFYVIFFSCGNLSVYDIKMFLTAFSLCILIRLKTEDQSYKSQIKILAFPGLA